MKTELDSTPLGTFTFEGSSQPIFFVETMIVTPGVSCDVYRFVGDESKDLGIIKIVPGSKTPLQKVLKGERTIEGYVSGKGKLVITKPDETKKEYLVSKEVQTPFSVTVAVGERMQWQATEDSPLVAYEICFPPYKDGRYENL